MGLGTYSLLALCALVGWTAATTFTVTNPKDGPGTCDGPSMCNLRGAWEKALGGDTIRIVVNVQMATPLTKNGTTQGWTGELSIVGALGGDASKAVKVTPEPAVTEGRLMNLIYIDETKSSLKMANLEISGFSVKCRSGPCEGGAVHISIEEALAPEEVRARQLGALSVPYPVFPIVLTLDTVTFGMNKVSGGGSTLLYGGALAVIGCGKGKVGGCAVTGSSTVFSQNTIEGGVNPAGSAVFLGSEANFNCTGCHFKHNSYVNTNYSASVMPGGAVVFAEGGDVTLVSGGFGHNNGGNGMAIALNARPTVFGNNHGDVFITGTKFNHNSGDSALKTDVAALIQAQHLHVSQSPIMNTDMRLLIASTVDDQYYSNCTLSGHTKLNGFSYYIRNLLGGAEELTAAQGTFNNCAQGKPWLPCPSGTTCTNVMNKTGTIVAYNCLV